MGMSFSFYSSYRKNPDLTEDQVLALYTPVTDMVADANIIFINDCVSFSVANYGSYTFLEMLEDHLRAAIFATMDPSQPTQLVSHSDEADGCNEYIYISHDPMKALEMELLDLNIELKNLTRKKIELEESIKELEVMRG